MTTEEQSGIETLSHRRILTEMAAVVLVSVIVSFTFASVSFGIGVLIGGILSLANYYWLKSSLKQIFAQALAGEKPQLLGLKYFFRYLTFAAILAFVYFTKVVPVVAVLLGLASFAAAIMVEAAIRLVTGVFIKKEI